MKKRVRLPRKMLLVATAGLASVTLNACDGFTSGNLVAPPPCDDAGSWECPPDGGQDSGPAPIDSGPADSGADAGDGEDAGSNEDAGTGTDA